MHSLSWLLFLHSAFCISSNMNCLITGAGGFIGSHLAEYLLGQNQSVVLVHHRQTAFLSSLQGDFKIVCGDLLEDAFINRLLKEHKPDVIFHLAAQSLPQTSWKEPALTFRVNLIGSLRLFDAVLRQTRPPLVIAASSSSVYAPCRGNIPLNEEMPLQPGSIYAASKMAMEQLAAIYVNAKAMKIICVRPFFVIGPRKQGDVCSDFARGIARIERGEADELAVGSLANVRDFLDVQDAVSALWQIAARGTPAAIYNICSGTGHSIGDLLALFKKKARVTVKARENPAKIRPIDDRIKIGDPARLMTLGWKQRIDLETSVSAILDYWRGIS